MTATAMQKQTKHEKQCRCQQFEVMVYLAKSQACCLQYDDGPSKKKPEVMAAKNVSFLITCSKYYARAEKKEISDLGHIYFEPSFYPLFASRSLFTCQSQRRPLEQKRPTRTTTGRRAPRLHCKVIPMVLCNHKSFANNKPSAELPAAWFFTAKFSLPTGEQFLHCSQTSI